MSTDALISDLATLRGDPYRFVLFAFPWGEQGTELADRLGPEPWQVELLCSIRDGLLDINQAIHQATASGHGVGKSALVSWLILWAMATFEDTRGVVTANTETQLKTKTWVELAKWYRLFIGKSLFHLTATCLYSVDPEHEKTWRMDMVPWSERNTEAFAGLHNQGKRILVVFDEASAIPDVIWETTEGALTDHDTEIIWAVFGNPTRNSGRFRECFPGGRFSNRWRTRAVDSRQVSFTNKEQIKRWIEDYGDDSDFVRIRVKGEFPRLGSIQFISGEVVREAMQRDVYTHRHDAVIFGVDVARFGDDESVVFIRKGRDARSIKPLRFQGLDTMSLAGKVVELINVYRPDAVFVDGGGVGGGVVDRLRQLRVACFDIQFGAKADRIQLEDDASRYANKRAEMWGYMRAALSNMALINDDDLYQQLTGPEYGLNKKDEILLEAKADMKKRGAASPDIADALALTFAYPVQSRAADRDDPPPKIEVDYDPFELAKVA